METKNIVENQTLKLILKFLKENGINNTEKAVRKNVAKEVVELCGYLVTIPVTNKYPSSIEKDLKELGRYNRKLIRLSDGDDLISHLISSSRLDGENIIFCSQKIQLEHLFSFIK